jgi:hypothetical protein
MATVYLAANDSTWHVESPSLVLVINDTKLLMPCVKCFELGISNTCDEGVRGKEWWPQDHKEMVHGHEMTILRRRSACYSNLESSVLQRDEGGVHAARDEGRRGRRTSEP